jgi:quinate/shikimate dehydrogenase (NAD+)
VATERFVVGLVGAGIGPSASPFLHESEADAQGLRFVYQLIDLDEIGARPEEVGDLLVAARRLGFRGLNVTHPCKQHVVPHLDRLSPEAAAIGAVNTVVFDRDGVTGHNTDVYGFRRSLELGLPDAPLDGAVVIGAGGAGAAAAYVVLRLGASTVSIIDIASDRARELADRLAGIFGPGSAIGGGPELLAGSLAASAGVVHATPTGMRDHPGTAFSPDLLRDDLWVAEVVYRPLETELLRQAKAVGCRTLDGGLMAVFQAAEAFRLFTGFPADAERMLRVFDATVRRNGDAPGDELGRAVAAGS